MYYRNSFSCATFHEGLVDAMSPGSARYPAPRTGDDDALVYTMRDLNQQASRVMSEIENSGQPAFITRHGRFIAVITPLVPGQVESQVLAEMAREISGQERHQAPPAARPHLPSPAFPSPAMPGTAFPSWR